MTQKQAYFSVQDMHAYYGESYIVQGVSFDVAEGEIVALLGRNVVFVGEKLLIFLQIQLGLEFIHGLGRKHVA